MCNSINFVSGWCQDELNLQRQLLEILLSDISMEADWTTGRSSYMDRTWKK